MGSNYNCPAGTLNPSTGGMGTFHCSTCPPGGACKEGASDFTLCGPGTYSNQSASVCAPCDAGYSCAGLYRTKCPVGQYSLSG